MNLKIDKLNIVNVKQKQGAKTSSTYYTFSTILNKQGDTIFWLNCIYFGEKTPTKVLYDVKANLKCSIWNGVNSYQLAINDFTPEEPQQEQPISFDSSKDLKIEDIFPETVIEEKEQNND